MKPALLLIAALIFLPAAAYAGSSAPKIFLIHVKRTMTGHDARTSVMPHVAMTALNNGYKVIILFDDEGVNAIRIGRWYGGHTTPLDKAFLPENERTALSAQLGVPMMSVPDNYGDLLRFLKGKGVELYANKAVMDLRNIAEDKFDHAVTPIGVEKIVEMFEKAAVIISY